jgi:hypothetical protein
MNTIKQKSTNYNDEHDQIQRQMISNNNSSRFSLSHSIEDNENNYSA